MEKINVFFVCLKRNKNGLEIDIFNNNWKWLSFIRKHWTLTTYFNKIKRDLTKNCLKILILLELIFFSWNKWYLYFWKSNSTVVVSPNKIIVHHNIRDNTFKSIDNFKNDK